ncbi:MAG TPA: DUF1836 domain-containing protein [Bacillota bacterium]|nr:DUF1836 domain-containing protein [Bacillota bacterium]HPE39042.1 DUF1836 domain-containing protein [Bacillota bacterium]
MAKSSTTGSEKPKDKQNEHRALTLDRLEEDIAELLSPEFMEWDRMPDIGLYMDQVLTIMERQLKTFNRRNEERTLTQAMINNYTKDGLLPRPVEKKYNREHIALLTILCALKPILSISDLSVLLKNACTDETECALYETYLSIQDQAIDESEKPITAMIEAAKEKRKQDRTAAGEEDPLKSIYQKRKEEAQYVNDLRSELAREALKMAIEARVKVMLAERIVDELGTDFPNA